MGFGKKIKKKAKKAVKKTTKATKAVKKSTIVVTKKAAIAKKQVQKVANTPIVKTAVTAVATTMAGPAGALAVEAGYGVLNSDNPMDLAIGAVCPSYTITKGYINQFKGQSAPKIQTQFKDQSSPLNASRSFINGVDSVSSSVSKKSFIFRVFEFFGF